MCIKSRLQQHIRNLIGNGEVVARFLVDTVEGKHSDAKYHHKLEAAKMLNRYGFSDDDEPSQFLGLIPTPEELAATPSRHPRAHGNPEGQGREAENPPLPEGEGWGEGEAHPTQTAPNTDDTPDCYHEPLNPDQQAIFDYQTKIESGEYKKGEIKLGQPTPEDWKSHELDLRRITEIAAAEGVPLLPTPGRHPLKMPNIRDP